MPPKSARRKRTRGAVDQLPSGALRVRIYAGKDPVSGRGHNPVEIIPAGPNAGAQAEAARVRLLDQVDERRNPRTSATVNQILDRYFELTKLALATLSTYVGYAAKHIRPLIGAEHLGRSPVSGYSDMQFATGHSIGIDVGTLSRVAIGV